MLTKEQTQITQEVILRLEKRMRDIWNGKDLNPYYVKGQYPTEIQDLVSKIKELKKKLLP